MQRLLITGGCGYLGRELVRRAPERGWRVRATWFEQPPRQDGAEWIRADLRDPEAASRVVACMDAVVHTAYRQGAGEWDTNVGATAAIAEAARGLRFVHLSTDLGFDGTRGRYREDDLELLPTGIAGPLHLGGADDLSRYDFAVLLGADPTRVERAHTTPDRAPDVSLDSSLAARVLRTRLRGAYEVLSKR